MNYYIFGVGLILLIITSSDLIRTALSAHGAGFISKRLSKSIWRILMLVNHNVGSKKILELGGAIILVSILSNWLILIWISSSLLFISQPDSLMNVETNTPANIISKIFYTGYTLSTLGLGDIEPYGSFWEILTSVMSFTGLILISIAITYLIPVVSAELEKRRISVYITTLGCSIREILINNWDNSSFKTLEVPFQNLTNMIILHAQNHKAYSVLHYFHTSNKKEAFVLNLTNLDESLSILLNSIPEKNRPQNQILISLRKAISDYLLTLPSAYLKPKNEIPPLFDLSQLEAKGIPIKQGEVVISLYNDLKARRRLLLALIKDNGWQWDDLEAGEYDHLISVIK